MNGKRNYIIGKGGKNIMKLWFQSWTIWANLIGIVLIILQFVMQINLIIDPEWQALILAIINILLRFKTTTTVARSIK